MVRLRYRQNRPDLLRGCDLRARTRRAAPIRNLDHNHTRDRNHKPKAVGAGAEVRSQDNPLDPAYPLDRPWLSDRRFAASADDGMRQLESLLTRIPARQSTRRATIGFRAYIPVRDDPAAAPALPTSWAHPFLHLPQASLIISSLASAALERMRETSGTGSAPKQAPTPADSRLRPLNLTTNGVPIGLTSPSG